MVHMESIIFAEALARINSFLFKGIELVIFGFFRVFFSYEHYDILGFQGVMYTSRMTYSNIDLEHIYFSFNCQIHRCFLAPTPIMT